MLVHLKSQFELFSLQPHTELKTKADLKVAFVQIYTTYLIMQPNDKTHMHLKCATVHFA